MLQALAAQAAGSTLHTMPVPDPKTPSTCFPSGKKWTDPPVFDACSGAPISLRVATSQRRSFPSSLRVTSVLPRGEKSRESTPPLWPFSCCPMRSRSPCALETMCWVEFPEHDLAGTVADGDELFVPRRKPNGKRIDPT